VTFKSVNPVDGTVFAEVAGLTPGELEAALQETALAAKLWADTAYAKRCDLMRRAATVLRGRVDDYAPMMTLEMGKPIREARAEIEKCAWVCEYYAATGPDFLADEIIESDASRSLVTYQPLGTDRGRFPRWCIQNAADPGCAGRRRNRGCAGACRDPDGQ